jgi:MFS family permease
MTMAMVVASLMSGRVTMALGTRTTATIGAALSSMGMALSGLVHVSGARDLMLPLSLLGFGLGLTTAPTQAAGLDAVPPNKSGMAAGVSSTARYLGGVVGVAIVGTLLANGDPLARHRTATVIFSVVLAVAALATRALPTRAVAKSRG